MQALAPLLKQAISLHDSGNLTGAEQAYREILAHDPNQPDALHLLGLLAHQCGHHQDAIDLITQASKRMAKNPYCFANLGEAHRALGQNEQALAAYRRALQLKPDLAEAHGNLGVVLRAMGQAGEARKCFERALKLNPDSYIDHVNLGGILADAGSNEAAARHFERALSLHPNGVEAHINLGSVLLELGRVEAAQQHCDEALRLGGNTAELHCNLGRLSVLQNLGHEKALPHFKQSLAIRPEFPQALGHLGNSYRAMGDLPAAEDCYRRALQLDPGIPGTQQNLGIVLIEQGRVEEGFDVHHKAVGLGADNPEIYRAYLMSLLYVPDLSPRYRYEQHQIFETRFAPKQALAGLEARYADCRQEKRKLRIGYVSSDFRSHPVGRNFAPIIENHDHARFELFLYANVSQPDEITHWFAGAVEGWRSILGQSDEQAARMMRDDKIDVLVFLAARFDANRPLIAAYRAAPVQVSMHDAATSGLSKMDYLLTDRGLSPRNSEELFTERLFHLPTFYVHAPLTAVPDVSALPALKTGAVTFGSFNNPSKLNDSVIRLWARVLNAVPGSRLMLKYMSAFSSEGVRNRYWRLFEELGIARARVDLVGERESRTEHLDRYATIDIALDPFPFAGSTTTFEALWMGAPVITLAGDTMVSRWTSAMLKKLDLDELAARDEDEYVAIAQRLAANPADLAALRSGLRQRVANSPLCDEQARTRQLERAYRWMWGKWCAEVGGVKPAAG